MKATNIILALFCLLIFSCRTIKTDLKEKTQQETTIHSDVNTNTAVYDKTVTDENINSSLNVASNVEKNIIDIEMSKPDSLGKQYPTRIRFENEVQDNSKVANTTANKKTKNDISLKQKKSEKLDSKSKLSTDKKENKKTEINTPAFISVCAGLFVIGLLVLLYFVLRRFKLIK